MNRKIKTSIICFGAFLCVAVVALYAGRNVLLQNYAKGKIEQLEKAYHLKVAYQRLYMPKINEVEMTDFSLVPLDRDTLLTFKSVRIELDILKLLSMRIGIEQVTTDGIHLSFVKKDSLANYDFLFRKNDAPTETVQRTAPAYSVQVSESLNLLFGFLPGNGEIRNLTVSQQRDTTLTQIYVPELNIRARHFRTNIIVTEDGQSQTWTVKGMLDKNDRALEAMMYAPDGKKIYLPYIHRYYDAQVSFDTLSCSLAEKQEPHNIIALNGKAEIAGLNVFHAALSPEIINLDKGKFDYRIQVGERFLELDSATTIQFNRLQFHPYLKAAKEDRWHITLSVDKPYFPADELFSSLPKGLFYNLEGLKTKGDLAYHFLLDVDFNRLDSLKFESELSEKDFRITGFGNTNLGKMNSEFTYTAYEQGMPVRTFAVGPSYADFTPLDSISPLLQMAVMQSEDGAFFYHQGFLIDAMREALIHDLKVKRFARGGSTITMQLVKNVFLNRNKNIARKLEEALIVWLIETERLTSKHRMYEVYLNIAEWGPLIYGAKEASQYYFNKQPSQLTASEAVFLASIIPKPKHFRSSFTSDMKLRDNLSGYYNLLSRRLKAKGLIAETDSIAPDIELTGAAKEDFNLSKDSMQTVLKERMDKDEE